MKEREKLMEEEEFKDYLSNSLNLKFFTCVGRFKSVQRAFRRGNITNNGTIVPRRAFHNRKNTCKRGKDSRLENSIKKRLYGEYLRNRLRGV